MKYKADTHVTRSRIDIISDKNISTVQTDVCLLRKIFYFFPHNRKNIKKKKKKKKWHTVSDIKNLALVSRLDVMSLPSKICNKLPLISFKNFKFSLFLSKFSSSIQFDRLIKKIMAFLHSFPPRAVCYN